MIRIEPGQRSADRSIAMETRIHIVPKDRVIKTVPVVLLKEPVIERSNIRSQDPVFEAVPVHIHEIRDQFLFRFSVLVIANPAGISRLG